MIINNSTLFGAWFESLQEILIPGVNVISPLIYSVEIQPDIDPEQIVVVEEIDQFLTSKGKNSVSTTANTIFPQSLWNSDMDRDQLYSRYRNILSGLHKCPANRRGIYFERIINYGYQHEGEEYPINQLEQVLNMFEAGNRRRSALHLSIFDPVLDHVPSRQLGFPCLMHIFFSPIEDTKLSITGMYGTQYIMDRALGNLLGIYRLGKFIAHELGRTLSNVTCMVSQSKLSSDIRITEARALEASIDVSIGLDEI